MQYSTPYQKVLCRFYDQLEIYSMHQTPLDITWKDGAGAPQEISTLIQTLETKNGEEFLVTSDDQRIRLDLITTLIINNQKTDVPKESCSAELMEQ